MKMEVKMKNGSQRYDISRSRPRDEHKYSKYKSVSAWWCFYILSNTWATFEAKFTEAVVRRFSVKKVFLKISQNSQEDTCARVSFLIKLQAWVCNFIKKETLAQVFFCKFCKISKNTFYRARLGDCFLRFQLFLYEFGYFLYAFAEFTIFFM